MNNERREVHQTTRTALIPLKSSETRNKIKETQEAEEEVG